MLFGQVIQQLSFTQRASIRKVENFSKKLVNAEAAAKFNDICLREDLLPNYSIFKVHDEAVRDAPETRQYRRKLVERQLRCKQEEIKKLQATLAEHRLAWTSFEVPQDLRIRVEALLQEELDQHTRITSDRIQRKLVRLNGGHLRISNATPGFVNLTDKPLTEDQEELLNLGLNCHVLSTPRPFQKRIELEALMSDLHKLASAGKVLLDDGIREDLLREARVQRGSHSSRILKRRHREAAKQLRKDSTITIRRADKAACFVLIPSEDYLGKIETLLADESKFQRITRNPTEALKTKVNKVIDAVNAHSGGVKLQKLTGDYAPGYCYGNVKTHKTNNPLRPIISQIPTPTYHLAKSLNALLTPFIPKDYSIDSAADFMSILKGVNAEGDLASLDAESLFTNVPVDRTIDYIIQEVYPEGGPAKLKIPKALLRQLLELCTKEAPFFSPGGHLYRQIDGVAMGSPLGVLFANFFMGMVEREVFNTIEKPHIYARYVDDIFVLVRDPGELEDLKGNLQRVSGLNFTTEYSINKQIPFLDVKVEASTQGFKTEVYTKPTNPGLCLNGNSECPQRFRKSTIDAYVRRALTHCSDWTRTHAELDRVTQVLVNNGFSNREVQSTISKHLDRWFCPPAVSSSGGERIKLFYKNTMSTQYRADEDALRKIINRDVKPTKDNDIIDLVIYYKNMKTSQLLIKNSPTQRTPELQRSHLVYEYTCKKGNCEALSQSYIGMTTTKLSRRLTLHLSGGAIKRHHEDVHQSSLTRKDLEEGIDILQTETDSKRLLILEALFIKDKNPSINRQNPDPFTIPTSKTVEHRFRITADRPVSGASRSAL